jgi:hypothetical protein
VSRPLQNPAPAIGLSTNGNSAAGAALSTDVALIPVEEQRDRQRGYREVAEAPWREGGALHSDWAFAFRWNARLEPSDRAPAEYKAHTRDDADDDHGALFREHADRS